MQEPPAYQLATPAGPKTSTVHLCYKQGLVRFSTSILLTLALVVTFAQAPFLSDEDIDRAVEAIIYGDGNAAREVGAREPAPAA